jgi:hypothetical protein
MEFLVFTQTKTMVKKMTLILISILFSLNLSAPDFQACDILVSLGLRDETLLRAIIQVESQGRPDVINFREQAIGLLQIRDVMLKEVNRIAGYEKYTVKDCLDSLRSIEMFWVVQDYQNPSGDYYTGARLWNGKSKRNLYWKKIKLLI